MHLISAQTRVLYDNSPPLEILVLHFEIEHKKK